MITVNVDLDGVVYPFHEVMALWTWQLRGEKDWTNSWEWDTAPEMPLPAPSKWDFQDQWGMSEGEFQSAFRLGVDSDFVWTVGSPLGGSVAELWRLSDAGVYIRIVTQRLVHKNNHATVQEKTARWLDKWNVPYHEILYVGPKSSKSDFRADYAIDDNASIVEDYLSSSDVEAYLYERPWNEDTNLPNVYGWEEFTAIVLKEEADV